MSIRGVVGANSISPNIGTPGETTILAGPQPRPANRLSIPTNSSPGPSPSNVCFSSDYGGMHARPSNDSFMISVLV